MVRHLVVHREPNALLHDLSKIGGCVLAIILNLVQRQRERGEGSTHPPEIDKCLDDDKNGPLPLRRGVLQVTGSPVSTGPFVIPKRSWSLQAC